MFLAGVIFNLIDILLDILLLASWADKQHILGVDYDIVAQTVDDCHLVLWQRNNRGAGVVGVTSILGLDIGIFVFARELIQRAPGADIAPAKVATTNIYILGLLHNAIIDRDGTALREYLLDSLLLRRCTK